MIPILLAAPEREDEPLLVRAAPAEGLRVMRRCVDAVELLSAAAAEPDAEVVLSLALPRLTSSVLEQVGRGRVIVGVASADAEGSRLATLGLVHAVADASDPQRTMSVIARLIAEARSASGGPRKAEVGADGPATAEPTSLGRLVAVWGPQGAPGRSTVAVGIADALSRRGLRTCLVDADTFAPSLGLALGVTRDASGLVAASRLVDVGTLDRRSLSGLMVPVREGLHLLTGLSDPSRWQDVRPATLEQVWSTLRTMVDVIVVDAGFCIEGGEDGGWTRSRNGVERAVLSAADEVVAVAEASALGAARLAGAWPALADVSATRPIIVRNRAGRRRRQGQPGRRSWVDGVRQLGVAASVVDLPADPGTVTRAWRHGRTPAEVAPRSRLCHALQRLADDLVSG